MPATMVWKISTCFDRLGGSEQVSILLPGAEAPEYLQQLRRRPEGRLYPNIDLFRVSLALHNRIVALASQLQLHGLGILDRGERANLHVVELVIRDGIVHHEDVVVLLA